MPNVRSNFASTAHSSSERADRKLVVPSGSVTV
jgi:hypothetical protein